MTNNKYISLLQSLIEQPSFSGEEEKTADCLYGFLSREEVLAERIGNNIYARNVHYKPGLPVLLLNSHHDTVKPNASYSRNPFSADIESGLLYGLGSNDAGASLVALLAAFLHYYHDENLDFNLVFLASAEEENSGPGGVSAVLPQMGKIDFAIVGEPTGMKMALAEKGLLVIDFTARGLAGHTARNEGENAIYKAVSDIEKLRSLRFENESEWLGPVQLSVTCIEAGKQHNVVPDICRFTADIRTNELYTHEEIIQTLSGLCASELSVRSLRLRPSFTPAAHPLQKAAEALGIECFGSPTLSDQALMPFPSVKIGPGESARSHTADEYVTLDEIRTGIETYIQLIKHIKPV